MGFNSGFKGLNMREPMGNKVLPLNSLALRELLEFVIPKMAKTCANMREATPRSRLTHYATLFDHCKTLSKTNFFGHIYCSALIVTEWILLIFFPQNIRCFSDCKIKSNSIGLTLYIARPWRSWICASWYDYENNQQDAIIQVNLLFLVGSTCFGRCFHPSAGELDCIYSFW